jgi:antitoxin FitA
MIKKASAPTKSRTGATARSGRKPAPPVAPEARAQVGDHARRVWLVLQLAIQDGGVLSLIAEGRMAQLVVRRLEPKVVMELRNRAARNGRSMEAEHREILRAALVPAQGRKSLKELLLLMPAVGEDSDFGRPASRPRRVRL